MPHARSIPSRLPWTVLLAATAIAAPTASASGREAETPEAVAHFDALVADYVARFGIAGAAVGVIDDGEVVLAKGYGLADTESGAPVSPDTRFNIGSVSKLVAAWGVMRLVDQGLVDLDAPVWEYVDTWKLPESDFDADGVTVRRLLSHTAGLSLHGYPGFALEDPLPTIAESLSGATNGSGDVRLTSPPGAQLRYSGGGYSLLQLMCEELTEKPLLAYMRAAVFEPLGMDRTGFNLEPQLAENTARPHGVVPRPVPDRAFRAEAAAAAYTSLNDFLRFAEAHFDLGVDAPAGRSVLSPEAVELLATPVEDSRGSWAHGPMIMSTAGGSGDVVFGHAGDNTGWHALIALEREEGDALIVFTNGDSGIPLRETLKRPWSELVGVEPPLPTFRPPAAIAVMGLVLEEGSGAAIAEYLRMREEEAEAYDFGNGYLSWVTRNLVDAGRAGDATELLAMGTDLDPEDADLWTAFARAQLALEDDDGARAACERALELAPGHAGATALLEEL